MSALCGAPIPGETLKSRRIIFKNCPIMFTMFMIGCRGLFPRVERPGYEADYSPPSSAEVKKGEAIPQPTMSSLLSA
jgi:hypothetical protein